jgi:hypothetical protein
MRTAEGALGSAADLLAATEALTSRCSALLESHPGLRGRDVTPVTSVPAAIRQSKAAAAGAQVGRLRQLDDDFFAQAGQFAAALAAMRARADDRRARAADEVRGLAYLTGYEREWAELADKEGMARKFSAIAEQVLAQLRGLEASDAGRAGAAWQARRAFVQAVQAYFGGLLSQQRLLIEQRRVLYGKGIRIGPPRVAPPGIRPIDWRVPGPNDLPRPRDEGLSGWDQWLLALGEALAAWLCETFGKLLAPYLTGRDELLLSWRREVAEVRGRADDSLVRATALLAEVEEASAALTRLRAERDAWHAADSAGLTPAVRAALAEVSSAARDAVLDPVLRDRLTALAAAGDVDVCVPIVATMKAGKSTTLGVLLGIEVAPRRAHTMTTVPTRYVLTDAVAEPRLDIGDAIASGYGRMLARIHACLPDSEPRLAAYPHLARFAAQLGRKQDLRPESCRGIQAVLDMLAFVNDLARVAMLVLPARESKVLADWVPEVLIPDVRQVRRQAGPRLRVTLVDTPGLGEAIGQNLLPAIVARVLEQADGCVLVLDYTQLNSEATTAMAAQVAKRFGRRTGSAVWVTVNRIDQRRSGDDLDEAGVRGTVGRLLGPGSDPVPVVETWAELALAVVGCERTPDPEHLKPLRALADPHGSGRRLEQDADRLIRSAMRRSGLGALRAAVTEDIARRGAQLAVESALERLTSVKAGKSRHLAGSVTGLRWALGAARQASGGAVA